MIGTKTLLQIISLEDVRALGHYPSHSKITNYKPSSNGEIYTDSFLSEWVHRYNLMANTKFETNFRYKHTHTHTQV